MTRTRSAATSIAVSVVLVLGTGAPAGAQTADPKPGGYGSVPMRKYGDVPAPTYGDVPAPKYGDVPVPPAPMSPDARTPMGDAPARTSGDAPSGRQEGGPAPTSGGDPKRGDQAAGAPGFSGRYFGSEGRTLHTWDFNPDGTFLHTRIVSGAGTNVRSSERGTFRLDGNHVELTIARATTGYTTPSVGGRGTLIGGGSEERAEVRRLRIELLPGGREIVLDGLRLKPKSW